MDNNVGKKLEDILKGMDKNKLMTSKRNVEQFLNTPEGRKLKQSLTGADKDKFINEFMKMDSDKLKQTLKNADTSRLADINAEEFLKKFK